MDPDLEDQEHNRVRHNGLQCERDCGSEAQSSHRRNHHFASERVNFRRTVESYEVEPVH